MRNLRLSSLAEIEDLLHLVLYIVVVPYRCSGK